MRARLRRFAAVAAALIVAVVVPLATLPTSAAPGEDTAPAPNPDLVAACGLDILVILDESRSIFQAGAVQPVRDAFEGFTAALQNTGSRMAVVSFETTAEFQIPYTTVTTQTVQDTFNPYIEDEYDPGESGTTKRTDWEDALRLGRFFAPRPSPDQPHLVVFLTDGDPNVMINTNRVPYDPGNPDPAENPYELDESLNPNTDVTLNANLSAATAAAVPNANAMKAQGSHVLAVAFGNALDNQQSLNRIIAMSGPDVWDGTNELDLDTTDVARVTDYTELEQALRLAAFNLCSPSVTVEKFVDQTPDPGTDDAIPVAGWGMTLTADPESGGFEWVTPPGATGDTATAATGPDGFATFQWLTDQPVASDITVVEADPAEEGLVNDPDETSCVYRTPDQPADQPLDITVRDGEFDATVPQDAIATCSFVNRAEPEPAITIEKHTNGVDADEPQGPFVSVGDTVTWSYIVTNTGNVTLDIAVTDDQLGEISCPQQTVAPRAEVVCQATGPAEAGEYENTGAVTGTDPFDTEVTDTDPSHYFGTTPGLDVQKFTVVDEERFDADLPTGPSVPVGDEVHFEYDITNTGNVALEDVALEDSVLGEVTCPSDTLAEGETITCETLPQAVVPGQYTNVATASAFDPADEVDLFATDPSNHFGEEPAITIEKATNDEDADEPTGPVLSVGDSVRWSYVVSNTGNVPLTNWQLTDDQGVVPACPFIDTIAIGASVTCVATGAAEFGQYENTGTVEAEAPSGQTVTDDDPSHHLGVAADISIEKSTNDEDADAPTGPFIPVGDPVTWTYEVTTTGTDPVEAVEVLDTRIGAPDPVLADGFNVGDTNQNDLLEQGETWQYEATGASEPDQYTNFSQVTGQGQTSGPVQDTDPSNFFGEEPGIHLEKLTNGVDADLPDEAVYVEVGGEVVWTFRVTNTGNVVISDIAVTDDQLGGITCPETDLEPDESMDCEATGTAERGPYENTGTVTGEAPVVGTITDTDPSHHFGYVTGVNIEKSTNGEDADEAPGPTVTVGDPVTWTYVVTPNDIPIHHVEVADDQGVDPAFVGGDTDGDDILDVDEEWTYEATGTAAEGSYENTATVTGLGTLEEILTDSDPSHHVGAVPPEPGPIPPAPPEPGPAPDLPDTGSGGVDTLTLLGLTQVLVGGMAILWAWTRDRARRSALPFGDGARIVSR